MKRTLLIIITATAFQWVMATTHQIGKDRAYKNIMQVAEMITPGDTILFDAGIYHGNQVLQNIQGTQERPITIMAVPGNTVIHQGGPCGWIMSDAAYINIQNIIFEQQTVNGFNMDDGGSYETPSHHIIFEGCTFRNINASGNNDLLKMSGVDFFEIRNCLFLNGAAGGSGIDMVGCHNGVIKGCRFENMGDNAICAKGGSQFIRIEGNFFKNCGNRSLNLGGSTGYQFFRPIDAKFEAADLQVYSNIFIGSEAPIAYVGSERVNVVNNTIYMPDMFVVRILQETVDTNRFIKCGNNVFRNNIIYYNGGIESVCNIGTDTAPESFHFSNNLWYNADDAKKSAPGYLPVKETNSIVGKNPLFRDSSTENFTIPKNSPAVGKGGAVKDPSDDYSGNKYLTRRSIGAYEGN